MPWTGPSQALTLRWRCRPHTGRPSRRDDASTTNLRELTGGFQRLGGNQVVPRRLRRQQNSEDEFGGSARLQNCDGPSLVRLSIRLDGRGDSGGRGPPPLLPRIAVPLVLRNIGHLRLRNGASGPEIDDFWGPNGPLLPQNPSEKVGGFHPTLLQWVLRWEGGRLDPRNRRFLARRLY